MREGYDGWFGMHNTTVPITEYVFLQHTQDLKERIQSYKMDDDEKKGAIDAYITYYYLKLSDQARAFRTHIGNSSSGQDPLLGPLRAYADWVIYRAYDVHNLEEKTRRLQVSLKGALGKEDVEPFKEFAEDLWLACRNAKLISVYSSVLSPDPKNEERLEFFKTYSPTDPEARQDFYNNIFQTGRTPFWQRNHEKFPVTFP